MMDGQAMYSPPTVPVFGDPSHPLMVTGFQPPYTISAETKNGLISGFQAIVNKRVALAAGKGNKRKYGHIFEVGGRQSSNKIDQPWKWEAEQARAFADETGCTIGYLRGETSTPTDDAPSVDLVARYYESLPPDLRKSVWAILKAAHESTIYRRFAEDNPGMIYDPLADDAPA